ncbi:MAG: MFS transporter [Chloroflexi bacterium]|nr:MFS transporter [Chloroflexota bacterium]
MSYVLSNIAWWMQMFGLGWLAVELAVRDGAPELAPFYIGLIGAARAVPAIAFTILAGAVVDRSERRALLLRSQAAATVLVGILAALAMSGVATIATVMVFTFLVGVVSSFDAPARQSLLPRLVPREDIMSAVGLQSMAAHATGIVGSLLAGLLIAPLGAGGLIMANAVGHLPVILAIALLPAMPPAPSASRPNVLRSVRDGLSWIVGDPVVRWVFVVAVCASLLSRPYLQLLPAFVANHLRLGPEALSLLLSLTGVGALVGSTVVASVGAVPGRGRIFLGGALAMAILVAALGTRSDLATSAVLCLVLGASTMLVMGGASAILQTATPDHLMGRVMAVQVTMFMGLMPVGQLLLGSLGSVVGIERVYVGAGAVAAVITVAAIRGASRLRELGLASGPALPAVAASGAE